MIVGLLSWYDEDPAWLTAAIGSYARAGVEHVVAVDGAYFLLKGGQATSSTDQHDAIREACQALGLGLTLHLPSSVWHNNEVEKRSFMFALAQSVSREGDWFCVIDADERVTQTPVNLQQRLHALSADVAELQMYQLTPYEQMAAANLPRVTSFSIRKLFRRQPEPITLLGNHYTYVANGKVLWGANSCEAAVLQDFRVEHRTKYRAQTRHAQQWDYYSLRDELGVEAASCCVCGARASRFVPDPDGWELTPEGLPMAGHVSTCREHETAVRDRSKAELGKLGFDLDELVRR